jgi:hypothetical protein
MHLTHACTEEARALIANDLRVLAAQLNERLEAAARAGLQVEAESRLTIQRKEQQTFSCPVISVRILAEVR